MSTVTGNITIAPKLSNSNATTLGVPTESLASALSSWVITSGTGENQVDVFYSDEQTALGTSSSQSYDLSGVLNDGICNSADFVTVKAIIITASASNVSKVTLDSTVANAFNTYVSVDTELDCAPGGSIVLLAPETGWAVTNATGDLLNIKNADATNTASYKIVILGTSA